MKVRELIDASPYAKKYTSGVLSFAEQDLPPGQREKLMASFERFLMPGLDKDQYSVLWVEHRDKGRLEPNFLIPEHGASDRQAAHSRITTAPTVRASMPGRPW
ncbi:hypothetical protein M8494_38045 [Serratia ureilytica]